MKLVLACLLATACATEGDTFKAPKDTFVPETEGESREGKQFGFSLPTGVSGLNAHVVEAGGPVGVAAPARCATEFVQEVVTQVCEDTVKSVCHTEFEEVCEDVVSSRTEAECQDLVVSEPREVCQPGPAREVCHEASVVAHHQECHTLHETQCHGGHHGYRGKREAAPTFGNREEKRRRKEQRRLEKELEKEQKDCEKKGDCYGRRPAGHRPVCHSVPFQQCRSVPVHHPEVACHQEVGAPICRTEFSERSVRDCRPVEVPVHSTVCRKIPTEVCTQVPEQICRKGGRAAPVQTRQICN